MKDHMKLNSTSEVENSGLEDDSDDEADKLTSQDKDQTVSPQVAQAAYRIVMKGIRYTTMVAVFRTFCLQAHTV